MRFVGSFLFCLILLFSSNCSSASYRQALPFYEICNFRESIDEEAALALDIGAGMRQRILKQMVCAEAMAQKLPAVSIAYIEGPYVSGPFLYSGILAGGADRSFHEPFRIGSFTKTYTAAMIFQAVHDGKLGLDDDLSLYFPDSPFRGVKLYQLLNHSSGIADYTESWGFRLSYFMRNHLWTPEEIYQRIVNLSEDRSPADDRADSQDSDFHYSNSNYVLAGLILEQVYNVPFSRVLERNLVQPGRFENTAYPGVPVESYDRDLNPLPGDWNTSRVDLSHALGAFSAGGISASPTEAAIFLRSLFAHDEVDGFARRNSRLIPHSVLIENCLADSENSEYESVDGYCYGLRRFNVSGRIYYGHTGIIPGFSAFAIHDPVRQRTLVIFASLSVADLEPIALAIMAL